MTNCVVGLVTCANRAEALRLARAILERKIAACVNIVPALESHYWWQGRLQRAAECLLLVKTTRARIRAVTAAARTAHSYQLPEIIFLPVTGGHRPYLDWVRKSVGRNE